jgi:trans-2-enoyl-CoA reductase
MVTYGGMAKKSITLSTGPLIFKDLRLQGFWLGKWKSNHSDEEFLSMVNYLLQLVCDGKLQYAMDEVQFSDFDMALQKALGQQGSALKQVLIFN